MKLFSANIQKIKDAPESFVSSEIKVESDL